MINLDIDKDRFWFFLDGIEPLYLGQGWNYLKKDQNGLRQIWIARNHLGGFLGVMDQKMPKFFVILDSFGLFLNTQLIGKRKKYIFLKNWVLMVLSPQGPPRALLWSGLVSDPGGLANDVSKAKLGPIFFRKEYLFFSVTAC